MPTPALRALFNVDLARRPDIAAAKGLMVVAEDFPSLAATANATCDLRIGAVTPQGFRSLALRIGAPDAGYGGALLPLVGVSVEVFTGTTAAPDWIVKNGLAAEQFHHVIGPNEMQWGFVPFEGLVCHGDKHNDSPVFRLTRKVAAAAPQAPVLYLIGYVP